VSVETDTHGAARPPSLAEALLAPDAADRSRPNVSGDISGVLQAAPMFRRAVLGYDRFQVDTYVRWAEDELVAADREREHLEARHLQTRADLVAAQELLRHSAGGAEMLRMSQRAGAVLAAAADEAAGIRTQAEAHRSAAAAEANRKLGYARWRIAYAETKAARVLADAAARMTEAAAAARRLVAAAEQTRAEAQTAAEERLAEVRLVEQRAVEDAALVRRRAADDVAAARVQARGEIVTMLDAARDQRRRADAEAAATRERQAREAAARYAALVAEVTVLEHRRAALRAELDLRARPAVGSTGRDLDRHVSQLLGKLRRRPLRMP
jgi:hypothetical protein